MAFERREHEGAAVATTITAGISGTDTSISIADATGWPDGASAPFWVVLARGLSSEEKVLVESRSGTTLTVDSAGDRGGDGTSAATHASGTTIEHCITAEEVDEANQAVVRLMAKGVPVALPFEITNAAAALIVGGAPGDGSGYTIPKAGSIVGISAFVNGARTAGSVTFTVTMSGGATLAVTIDGSNTQHHEVVQAPGVDTFAAGEVMVVSGVASSFTPGSNPGSVIVWVVLDAFT